MKKFLLSIVLLSLAAIAATSASAQINKQCPQFTVNGTPQYAPQPGDQELCHMTLVDN